MMTSTAGVLIKAAGNGNLLLELIKQEKME